MWCDVLCTLYLNVCLFFYIIATSFITLLLVHGHYVHKRCCCCPPHNVCKLRCGEKITQPVIETTCLVCYQNDRAVPTDSGYTYLQLLLQSLPANGLVIGLHICRGEKKHKWSHVKSEWPRGPHGCSWMLLFPQQWRWYYAAMDIILPLESKYDPQLHAW